MASSRTRSRKSGGTWQQDLPFGDGVVLGIDGNRKVDLALDLVPVEEAWVAISTSSEKMESLSHQPEAEQTVADWKSALEVLQMRRRR